MTDKRKNIQRIPTRTYYKRSWSHPTLIQISRTPQHWKFTQHHCTTQPPTASMEEIDLLKRGQILKEKMLLLEELRVDIQ